ncbi:MAG: fibronectin type III domain-containing protein [Candidatus Eiseniibacteriota bacterium]
MLAHRRDCTATLARLKGTAFGLALLTLALAWPMTTPSVALAQTSTDSTVVLQWTAPGDDGTVGRATSYDLRYRTVTISGTDTTGWWNSATQVSGEPAPGVSGATDSMRVRGLVPATTYYFIVRAADEVPNWSGFSNLAVKTTTGSLDNTPPAAITTLAITGQTGTTIALRWTATGNDGTTGTAASYDIRYSTSTITAANWASATTVTGEPAPTASGTQQTFTVTGLQPSRVYYIAIRATDAAGNVSAISNVPNGSTLDTVPPAPVHDLSYETPSGAPVVAFAEETGGEAQRAE